MNNDDSKIESKLISEVLSLINASYDVVTPHPAVYSISAAAEEVHLMDLLFQLTQLQTEDENLPPKVELTQVQNPPATPPEETGEAPSAPLLSGTGSIEIIGADLTRLISGNIALKNFADLSPHEYSAPWE